jgi:hypothetical protein
VYRSSRQKFFNSDGSFTPIRPAESPSRAGVDTLMVVPSRSGSKKRPPLAGLGRESWPTTVVDVAQLSAVRGFITEVTDEAISIPGAGGAPLEFSLSPTTLATSIDIELSHVVGRVDSINGLTLLISGRPGVLRTVVVGPSTAFLTNGVIATLDDVAVGSYVAVEGTYNAAVASLAASVVDIGRSRTAASSLHDEGIQESSIPRNPHYAMGHGESADAR